MANGKDALSYALSKFIFSSVEFSDEDSSKFWKKNIEDLDKILIDEEITNPAQKVKLIFANNKYYSNEKTPKVIIMNKEVSIKHPGEIILEASSGEDCARLLSISHTIAQRFSLPIYLILSIECLNQNLNLNPEHIPFPPKFIIRENSWKPDKIYANNPALSFKRINYGKNRGPRDKSKILVISHGKNSLLVKKIISDSNENIRHLEIQTLRPISKEIVNQAMMSVKKTISIDETFYWLEQNDSIESFSLEQLVQLIN